jgi:hypothetical protein
MIYEWTVAEREAVLGGGVAQGKLVDNEAPPSPPPASAFVPKGLTRARCLRAGGREGAESSAQRRRWSSTTMRALALRAIPSAMPAAPPIEPLFSSRAKRARLRSSDALRSGP